MNTSDKKLLQDNGWVVECESPFELRHEDGSVATLNAAQTVLYDLKYSTTYISGGYHRFFEKCIAEGWDQPNTFVCFHKSQIKEGLLFLKDALNFMGTWSQHTEERAKQTHDPIYGCDISISADIGCVEDYICIPCHELTLRFVANA